MLIFGREALSLIFGREAPMLRKEVMVFSTLNSS
jgi:hypothetical protein